MLDSLVNVRGKLKFFEDVAKRYGLVINVDIEEGGVSEGVKLYRNLFFGIGEGVKNGDVSMVEALVVLWGTEKVSLSFRLFSSLFVRVSCRFSLDLSLNLDFPLAELTMMAVLSRSVAICYLSVTAIDGRCAGKGRSR
jgi:hypothetical protein